MGQVNRSQLQFAKHQAEIRQTISKNGFWSGFTTQSDQWGAYSTMVDEEYDRCTHQHHTAGTRTRTNATNNPHIKRAHFILLLAGYKCIKTGKPENVYPF